MTDDGANPLGPRPDVIASRDGQRARSVVRAALFPGEAEPERVDRYRLCERIGAGAMGVVYEAVDEELDRAVAVKLVAGRAVDAGAARDAVWSEAQALARISHPNVAAVYDVGWDGANLYIAMELVRGATIDQWAAAKRPGWRAVVEAFAQAADGLAAVHATGLVHRDVKPANLRVGDDGRVRVIDFGLAGREPARCDAGEPDAAGTPAYMAPEQRRGAGGAPAADQYSLAVALVETLSGERPAEAGDALRGVPRSVRRVVARGLAPDSAARWPDVAAFARALRASASRARALASSATVVAFAAVLLVVALFAGRSTEEGAAATAQPDDPRLAALGWRTISRPIGHFGARLDEEVRRGGSASATIASSVADARGFGALAASAPAAPYRGKRVRMTGWLRTRDAAGGGAALWLRVDDQAGFDVAFDNMYQRSLRGDWDWTQAVIVLDVPARGETLHYGCLIEGGGQVWLDDVVFEVVSTEVPVTDRPSTAADLGFEPR